MQVDSSNELAIGNLLLRAGSNEIVKRVISVFDHSAKRSANVKSISTFNLDMLEPCAEFLNIALADSEENKLYTKDSLVNRIQFELRALLPSECSECNETYIVEFEADQKPVLHSHMCFRGSHDCSAVTSFNDVLTSAPATVLSSYVWLCKSCKESSIPIKPRKSKSRHDSIVNKSNSVSQQLKEDSIDSQISSSQEITDHSTLQSSAAIDNSDLHEKSSVAATERICEKYKRGKCPHGLKGKKKHNGQICEFEHPKYCNRFCRYGKQLKFGCSKGPDCKFLHPELCKFSVKNKLCTKSDCTFIHLKGTRRQTNNSAAGHKGKAENKKSDQSKGVTKANQDQDFLELRRLLETMQTRIELLSEKVDQRSSLPQTQMPYHYPRPPSASPLQSGTVLPPYHYHYPQFLPPQRTHVPIIPHASS